jgi:ATP-dependent Lon protease
MEKTQREYYLNEQLKAIQRELGNESEDGGDEIAELAAKIRKTRLARKPRSAPLGAQETEAMAPMSAEATVARNYLDVLLGLPWGKKSSSRRTSPKPAGSRRRPLRARRRSRTGSSNISPSRRGPTGSKGPILCLVGPPGVGKTSLGRSIARATGREFARQSLGGVRDEAEIRGHRRTYIGSLPGKIIRQSEEGRDVETLVPARRDRQARHRLPRRPASALLEVLDPSRTSRFQDHYLELDYDLSDVMFVTTANSLDMPQPLLDRMEIIRLEGYTEDEKVEIARRHLIPKQMEAHGVKDKELAFTDEGLRGIIRHYTREAGVRTLERELAKVARKSLRKILEGKTDKVELKLENLSEFLGVRKFRYGVGERRTRSARSPGSPGRRSAANC